MSTTNATPSSAEGAPAAEVFDFTGLDPSDGFRIKCSTAGGELSLHLTVRMGGKVVDPGVGNKATVELARWPHADDVVSRGQANRLRNVLEAVARYLTVGGDWVELGSALKQMTCLAPAGGFVYPGWHYSKGDTLYDPHACVIVEQHRFVADKDEGVVTPAVIWVEKSFIDVLTLGELKRAKEKRRQHITPDSVSGGEQKATLQLPSPEDIDGQDPSDGTAAV